MAINLNSIHGALPDFEKSIDDILRTAVISKASDIHFHVGAAPRMRYDGSLIPIPEAPVSTLEWLRKEMRKIAGEDKFKTFEEENELDFSHEVPGYGRFRVNFYLQSGAPAAACRTIPENIKTVEELGLPKTIIDISQKPNGLVLVTGPTGSGKSSTLAAMIEERNRTNEEHIMTIEDPIEFIYKEKKAWINQREIGRDTKSFNEALKRVLRQDPDVILIGELRDPETIRIALTAAETGHLVFGTLHTQSAAKSINRIIDSFSAEEKGQIKTQLSDTLNAIIAQTLLKKEGGGRVVATEIMVKNSAIASQIQDGNTKQIRDSIQTGKNLGMHTLDQDLVRLIREGAISKDTALIHMIDKNKLDNLY